MSVHGCTAEETNVTDNNPKSINMQLWPWTQISVVKS